VVREQVRREPRTGDWLFKTTTKYDGRSDANSITIHLKKNCRYSRH